MADVDKINENISRLINPETEENPDHIKVEDLGSPQDQSIENYIQEACFGAGATVKALRAGMQGETNPDKRQAFHEVRDRIIKELASGKFGKLNQTQIGNYLGISNPAVSARMGKIGISPMCRSGAQSNRKISIEKKAPQPTPATPPETKETPVQMVIDFTGHIEIHTGLIKTAADQLRTPEMQALYVLKKYHFWGQIPPDTDSVPGEDKGWTGRE